MAAGIEHKRGQTPLPAAGKGVCPRLCGGLWTAVLVVSIAADANAQTTAALIREQVQVAMDSGVVTNPAAGPAVVYSTRVRVADAAWLQLVFDEVTLGRGAAGGRAILRMTSLADGAAQTHTAVTLTQWQNRSAYFNGDAVHVEIIAPAHAAASHVRLGVVWAGPPTGGIAASICGPTDDRVLSFDRRTSRSIPIGCTAWLINDAANCMLTAGHCSGGSLQTVEFNVPLSDRNGNIRHPGPEDQYAVDVNSKQFANGGIGDDWGYFGCFPNTETGLTPGEAQGLFYTLAATVPPVNGQDIRITGYGFDTTPPTSDQVQQTHAAPYVSYSGTFVSYVTDTQGGNSGSAVVDDSTGLAIGVHTHGGCNAAGGTNIGTGIDNTGLQNALNAPLGVCVPLCPWDLDGTGDVGINDFLALLAVWGQVGVPADFDGGGVGVTDFLELLANWGPCPG